MDEQVYQVTGYNHGTFADDQGRIVRYANLFCVSPFNGEQNENYHYSGLKAFTFKCVSPDVLKDVKEKDKVQLFFNQRQRVCLIQKVN